MQLPANIGKYELLEFLGGGMSQVYRSRDTVIGRPVVVKVLTESACSDPEAKARFLQEARLAGNIQHENIVSVFDFGEHEGRPYIVMEYLKGEDLRDAIKNGRAGSLFERLKIALQIAEALDYVHERGIVHRDIKPENIHIDPTGRVKLMDFGIAKTEGLSLTHTGMAMGTPYYMAPEQVSGRPTTVLVDVYAFGMLLFELITGSRGITAETMEAVFYQILNQPLDVAMMENAGAPPAVRDLVMQCTAKHPEDRPQGFKSIAETIKGILSGQNVAAPRTNVAAPPPASSRKAILLGLIGALVIIAIGVGAWFVVHSGTQGVPGMIYFKAGSFLSGADKKSVQLPAFYIDETEVSNAEFAEFCRTMGCPVPTAAPELPVVNVSVELARAFAKWKGKRLPSPQEWERAVRGTEGAFFPWGNEEDASKANVSNNPIMKEHILLPARAFEGYPTYNMIGNAWEMVEGEVTPIPDVVTMFSTLLTPPPTATDRWISIRGGAFDRPLTPALSYDSATIPERYTAANIGFRCAKTAN